MTLYKLSEPRLADKGEWICCNGEMMQVCLCRTNKKYQVLEPVEPELSPVEGLAEAVRGFISSRDYWHECFDMRDALKRYDESKKENNS